MTAELGGSSNKTKLIRNSTVEFLIFTGQAGEQSIEARYVDESVWLTQKLMAELYAVDVRTVSEHLKNIYESGELAREATVRKFRTVQVRNKLHFAIHGHTAAELIVHRADATQPHMGLTNWEKAPEGKILKTDVAIAKNYLSRKELEALGRIVNAYLDLAEERAQRKIPMTMEDWGKRLDAFLAFADRDVLPYAGQVSAEMAKSHAESEFEKYRVVQDRLFESDFDRVLKQIEAPGDDSKPA